MSIKHLDLLNDFTDSEQELFYQYDEHLNVLGHEQMAISIHGFLGDNTSDKNRITFLSNLLSIYK